MPKAITMTNKAIQLRYSDGMVMVLRRRGSLFRHRAAAVEACQRPINSTPPFAVSKSSSSNRCTLVQPAIKSFNHAMPMPTGGHLKVFIVGSSSRFNFVWH
jgi:hypothetical protein